MCEKSLGQGVFSSPEEMREFYAVMGPMVRAIARRGCRGGGKEGAASSRPQPLNRAFGPDGFLRRFDLRPELEGITAPTLVMAGRHDWICPPEFSEEIARLIPGADLRIFERSSHSIRSDEPEAMVDAILGFIVYRAKQGGVFSLATFCTSEPNGTW